MWTSNTHNLRIYLSFCVCVCWIYDFGCWCCVFFRVAFGIKENIFVHLIYRFCWISNPDKLRWNVDLLTFWLLICCYIFKIHRINCTQTHTHTSQLHTVLRCCFFLYKKKRFCDHSMRRQQVDSSKSPKICSSNELSITVFIYFDMCCFS